MASVDVAGRLPVRDVTEIAGRGVADMGFADRLPVPDITATTATAVMAKKVPSRKYDRFRELF